MQTLLIILLASALIISLWYNWRQRKEIHSLRTAVWITAFKPKTTGAIKVKYTLDGVPYEDVILPKKKRGRPKGSLDKKPRKRKTLLPKIANQIKKNWEVFKHNEK